MLLDSLLSDVHEPKVIRDDSIIADESTGKEVAAARAVIVGAEAKPEVDDYGPT